MFVFVLCCNDCLQGFEVFSSIPYFDFLILFSHVWVVQLSYSDLQCILCWQVSNSFQDLKAALVRFQHEDRSIGFGTRR